MLTKEQAEEAIRSLRRLYVQLHNVSASGYRTVASAYQLSPEELREEIVKYKKDKARRYMRDYMRKRRGGLKRG